MGIVAAAKVFTSKANETDIKTFVPFAYASTCRETWENNKFPQGNEFERKNPSVLHLAIKDEKTTASVYIATNNHLKAIIISFKPSTTRKLWTMNAKMWTSDITLKAVKKMASKEARLKIEIHHGFIKIYAPLRQRVLDKIAVVATTFPDYRIVFTGISLGGSLASITAIDFSDVYLGFDDRINLITFGEPRTGNKHWAKYVNSKPFSSRWNRVVRFGDPIPRMPPRMFGFQHAFQENIVYPDGTLAVCPRNRKGTGECDRHDFGAMSSKLHTVEGYMEILGQDFICDSEAA